ncbi:MAG: fluoride efflux transporter CrcB [Verrucomicrobiales bacterium]
MTYLIIGFGGALGTIARFWLSGVVGARYGEAFPLGTLVVNVSGSFAIGFIASLTGAGGRWLIDPKWRQFFMVGFCGGYTTFSAFSLETLGLLRDREWLYAGSYAVLSFILCLAAVWLGHVVAAALSPLSALDVTE